MSGAATPKVTGMSIGQPPFLSVISLELARAVLKGEHAKTEHHASRSRSRRRTHW